jgi:hypothetical protein
LSSRDIFVTEELSNQDACNCQRKCVYPETDYLSEKMYTFELPTISNVVLLILRLISMEHLQIIHRRRYWNGFVTSTLVTPTINSRELVNAFGEGYVVRNVSSVKSHMYHINSRVRSFLPQTHSRV